jgi:hypothetical protein
MMSGSDIQVSLLNALTGGTSKTISAILFSMVQVMGICFS